MKIDTALILCAGFGKRLEPLTLKTPKPLLKIKDITLLERCINISIKLGIKKIFINTFHLKDQINNFINEKKFSINIKIVNDGKVILDTGGGILNMMNSSLGENFLIFNPDTIWSNNYVDEIVRMRNFYLTNDLSNILLVSKKELSFDKNLKGDFDLENNLLNKNKKNFIFIGCQILKKKLFKNYSIKNFPISEIWNKLLLDNQLNGFESFSKFYHATNLEVFSKLKDS